MYLLHGLVEIIMIITALSAVSIPSIRLHVLSQYNSRSKKPIHPLQNLSHTKQKFMEMHHYHF